MPPLAVLIQAHSRARAIRATVARKSFVKVYFLFRLVWYIGPLSRAVALDTDICLLIGSIDMQKVIFRSVRDIEQLIPVLQTPMDVLKAVQFYVNRMLSSASGIKVLLLDAETASSRRNSLAYLNCLVDSHRVAGQHHITPAVTRGLFDGQAGQWQPRRDARTKVLGARATLCR